MAKNSKSTVKVEGMTCSNCALSVTKSLEKLGLENVHTDFINGEVVFDKNETVEFEEISVALDKIGYKAVSSSKTETEERFSTIDKKFFFSLIFTVPLFSHMFFPHESLINNAWVQFSLCLPVYLIGFMHYGKSGWGSLRNGVPNMDVLIWIGSTAAFVYSLWGTIQFSGTHEIHNYLFYETAATIITLVFLGNVIEHRSVKQTSSSIGELIKLQRNKAKRIVIHEGHEHFKEVDANDLMPGDLIQVNNGDRISADGIVLSGNAAVNESMLTGESLPVSKSEGSEVFCGTIIQDGNIRVKVTRAGNETVLSEIIQLVKEAQQKRPAIQKLGDKISAIFVPVVLLISILTFFGAWLIFSLPVQQSIMQAIAVLVISCPCAMGLAAPTAVVAGLGRAARKGILIKGGDTLEQLAGIKTVVFDKTGTLTTGNFKIKEIKVRDNSELQSVKNTLFSLETYSSHPLAVSIVSELKNSAQRIELLEIEETKGKGISANDKSGNKWFAGKSDHNDENNLFNITLFKNTVPVADIFLSDEVKPKTAEAIKQLDEAGMETIMLSGDSEINCRNIAVQTGIKKVYSEKLPAEKLSLIHDWNQKNPTAMVGDGINDAPSLATATIGISMGDATQVAINAAQVVILKSNDLRAVNDARLIGKHTLITIKQNFFWAFFYNVIAIPIAAAGFLSPMIAALSMAFSDVIVVGNSIRLKTKKLK